MRHKTALEQFIELRIATSNLGLAILKGLCEDCWIFRMLCRLLGLEEVLIIQKGEEDE